MTKSKDVDDIAPLALSELYGINADKITRVPGGRLSDTFKIEKSGEKPLFLKISRQVEENTPFSTKVTEAGRELGFPFPKTYAGINKQLYQEIPAILGGKPVPDFLKGMTVTLVDYHQPPLPAPDTAENNLAKFYEMGKYLGQYYKFREFLIKNMRSIPSDPLSPENIRGMIYKTFDLSSNMSKSAIDARAKTMAENLAQTDPENKDPVKKSFADGLKNRQLSTMLDELNALILEDGRIKDSLPQGILNNDIKHNNLFFDVPRNDDRQQTGAAFIALAFDLDMATKGPLVKDLGRTIALTCFDKNNGSLQSENMLELINGRVAVNKLNHAEIKALSHYIELGILASYALRTSYFAEMLRGEPAAYEIDRPNPSNHAAELKSFREWNKCGRLETTIAEMQKPLAKSWKEKHNIVENVSALQQSKL